MELHHHPDKKEKKKKNSSLFLAFPPPPPLKSIPGLLLWHHDRWVANILLTNISTLQEIKNKCFLTKLLPGGHRDEHRDFNCSCPPPQIIRRPWFPRRPSSVWTVTWVLEGRGVVLVLTHLIRGPRGFARLTRRRRRAGVEAAADTWTSCHSKYGTSKSGWSH